VLLLEQNHLLDQSRVLGFQNIEIYTASGGGGVPMHRVNTVQAVVVGQRGYVSPEHVVNRQLDQTALGELKSDIRPVVEGLGVVFGQYV